MGYNFFALMILQLLTINHFKQYLFTINSKMMQKVFHKRNLPHFHHSDGIYFITYRLINSISQKVINELKVEYRSPKKNETEKFRRMLQKYDKALDSGELGEKHLNNPKILDVCKLTLHYPDGKDYRLICYTIMPNHIHLLFELLPKNKGISKIMQSIKRISALESNKILNREGSFWQDESYDRLVRDDIELYFIIKYILQNPVDAGLVKNWSDWKHTYCHPHYQVLN